MGYRADRNAADGRPDDGWDDPYRKGFGVGRNRRPFRWSGADGGQRRSARVTSRVLLYCRHTPPLSQAGKSGGTTGRFAAPHLRHFGQPGNGPADALSASPEITVGSPQGILSRTLRRLRLPSATAGSSDADQVLLPPTEIGLTLLAGGVAAPFGFLFFSALGFRFSLPGRSRPFDMSLLPWLCPRVAVRGGRKILLCAGAGANSLERSGACTHFWRTADVCLRWRWPGHLSACCPCCINAEDGTRQRTDERDARLVIVLLRCRRQEFCERVRDASCRTDQSIAHDERER